MFFGNTLKKRLLFVNFLIGILLVSTIISIFYFSTKANTMEDKKDVLALEVERESVYLEREFSKIYETTQLLQITILQLIDSNMTTDSREYLLELAEETIKNNENIIGVNYYFEPNIIEDDSLFAGDDRFKNDGQFITYVSVYNNVPHQEYLENIESYEMYRRVITEKKDFFTEPYTFDVQGNNILLSTVVFPLLNNGEFIGFVGIDFTSDYIFSKIQQLDYSYPRRDIIVSQDGTILINTDDVNTTGEHISTIHEKYYISLSIVDTKGLLVGQMEGLNHTEVINRISLGSSGEYWYIFSDVDNALLLSDINQASLYSIFAGIAILIIYLLGIFFITNATVKPVTELTKTIDTFDVETDNITNININTRGLVDIRALIKTIIDNYSAIQQNMNINKNRLEINEKSNQLRTAIETSLSIKELANNTLESLLQNTNSIIGTMYIKQNESYHLFASIGTSNDITKKFDLDQGILGKAAQQKEIVVLENSAITPTIDIGVSQVNPPYVYICPIVDQDECIAIYQLVSLERFSGASNQFLSSISYTLTTSIQRQIISEKTKILYEETKKLATELELQQEELRVKNEELESQQEELRVTNEELETQQEELRVANKELQFNLDQIEVINQDLNQTKIELQERTQEAEQSNKSKSEFLANMSHELRTPLNSILILSNLISENKDTSEKLKEYALTINSAGSDLLELINGILDLSKVEAGREKKDIETWSINDNIDDLESRCAILAQNKNITFKIVKLKTNQTVKTDIQKVKTILQNLLTNAIKFTEKGSVELHILDHKNEIEFQVKDTGIGISPEELESIFDEFTQTESDSKRKYSGTGLGLSISKKYAELLGGRIVVESTVGTGSTFTFFLPKQSLDNDNVPKQVEHSSPMKRTPVHRVTDDTIVPDDRYNLNPTLSTVLIIDDDENTLSSLRDYFHTKNINVLVTNTGENGLFLADYYVPNLIILDIKLPKMDGMEISSKLQMNRRTSAIPIILISGEGKPKDNEFPFYKKPLSKQALTAIRKQIPTVNDQKWRILFVEDDELHLRSMVEYVTSHHDETELLIDTAQTKKETLKQLEKSSYSLLVIDLHLHDASDFELVEEIRANDKYKKTPIIVYTGKRFTDVEEQYLSSLVDDIIIKAGKSPERLLQNIELFLKGYNSKETKTDRTIFEDKTVLIVDDDIRNIFALTGLLETYGVHVEFNTSGKEAIERLKKDTQVNLILMDIMMPEMDGYETTRRIRKMDSYKDKPIIALTAKSMRGDREKCIEAGATEYLSKPVNKDKLFSVLRVWLQ